MNPYKSNIWKMYLYMFLRSLHFVGGVLVPFFTDWGNISFTQIMILQSFFVFSVFALEVPTGAVADYFGRKTSLAFGSLALTAGALVYTSAPIFYIFLLGEFLWALGAALISGANEAIIYDSLKKTKQENTSKKVFSRFETVHLFALMVAAPIGSFIAAKLGLRYAMMMIAVPFFISFLVSFTIKEPEIKKTSESKRYFKTLVSGIRYFKNHRILQILVFDRVSISVLAFFLIWLYQPLLKELHLAIIYFGIIHAGITIAEIIFMNLFGILEKWFGSKKRYLLFSAIITGVGFILLAFFRSLAVVIILFFIVAGFGLTRKILFQSYFNKFIESHNRATVLSTVSMIERFAMGITFPLVGLMVEASLRYTFFIIGIIAIILALISRVEEHHLLD